MRLWQSAMISLAKNEKLTATMQSSAFVQRFASQFVGGTDGSQALDTVARLRERGIRTSVFCLGEYIRDADLVEQCVMDLLHILPKLSEVGLDTHVSVDPTQMGASIDWALCAGNVKRVIDCVAQLATPQRKVLMLDMEDSSFTDATLNLWDTLHSNGYPVAITIQAYLRRSERDIRRLVEAGATVRLVKGALAEKADVAYRARSDIDANYRALTEMLLSADAKTQGAYPAFGTHDEVWLPTQLSGPKQTVGLTNSGRSRCSMAYATLCSANSSRRDIGCASICPSARTSGHTAFAASARAPRTCNSCSVRCAKSTTGIRNSRHGRTWSTRTPDTHSQTRAQFFDVFQCAPIWPSGSG